MDVKVVQYGRFGGGSIIVTRLAKLPYIPILSVAESQVNTIIFTTCHNHKMIMYGAHRASIYCDLFLQQQNIRFM